jgi:hypothetical protein
MQTLSEKAKGKQRADPIPEDAFNRGGPIPQRQLMVRFTEGVQDLVLHVAEHDSVRDVKAKVCMPCPWLLSPYSPPVLYRPIFFLYTWRHVSQIREARPKLQRRRLRLIHAGRLLADGTHLESWLGTLEERQQRAAATRAAKDEPDPSILPNAPPPSSAAALPWLHCSVGAQLSDGEEDGEVQPQVRPCSVPFPFLFLPRYLTFADDETLHPHSAYRPYRTYLQEAQIKPLRGFDRLAAAGFSEDDILNFRRQFHSRSAADYISTAEFPTEEECASVRPPYRPYY